jgi:hypothetical protein
LKVQKLKQLTSQSTEHSITERSHRPSFMTGGFIIFQTTSNATAKLFLFMHGDIFQLERSMYNLDFFS